MIDWAVPAGCSRLLLIRHAEPDRELEGRCYGSLDVGLSPRGRAQAAALGALLAGAPLAAVYASPRRRALDTAAPLGRPVQIAEGLREIDFGRFEGLTYDEAAALAPDVYRAWMERPTEVAFPGGESYPELRARVRGAAAGIRAAHGGACAAIVAHGGTVRTLVAEALGLPDAHIFRIDVGHASVTVLDWFPDGTPIARLVNGRPA